MNTHARLGVARVDPGRGMALAAGAVMLWVSAAAASPPPVDVRDYSVPSSFEGGTVMVAHDAAVASLARRLADDLTARLEGLDLRLVKAEPGSSAHLDASLDLLLTVDPALGQRSSAARDLRRRWGGEPRQVALGYDAMLALARPEDPVIERGMSVAELGAIFGAGPARGIWPLREWPQIDGRGVERDAVAIERVAPADETPFMSRFRSVVLLDQAVDPEVARVVDAAEVGPWVAARRGALGVAPRSAWQGKGAQVPLAWDMDEACLPATAEHLQAHGYPLIMPLRAYVPRRAEPLTPAMREWLDYLLSAEGQGIIAEAGLVPLRAERVITQRQWLGLE